MTAPTDPIYWEDWARGLGWDSLMIKEAGRVGSLAVQRRMTPPQAMDCVVERVREGKNIRIGRPLIDRVMMDRAFPSILIGLVVLIVASIPFWNGGFSPGVLTSFGFVVSIIGGLGFALRGVTAAHWRVGAVGIGLNLLAIATLAAWSLRPTS